MLKHEDSLPGDGRIDLALRALPMDEAPASLLPGILNRIQSLPRQAPASAHQHRPAAYPHFGLTWLDVVLSLFFSGMLAVIGLLSQTLPASLVDYLKLEGLYWLQRVQLEPWLPVPILAALLLIIGQVLVFAWALKNPGTLKSGIRKLLS